MIILKNDFLKSLHQDIQEVYDKYEIKLFNNIKFTHYYPRTFLKNKELVKQNKIYTDHINFIKKIKNKEIKNMFILIYFYYPYKIDSYENNKRLIKNYEKIIELIDMKLNNNKIVINNNDYTSYLSKNDIITYKILFDDKLDNKILYKIKKKLKQKTKILDNLNGFIEKVKKFFYNLEYQDFTKLDDFEVGDIFLCINPHKFEIFVKQIIRKKYTVYNKRIYICKIYSLDDIIDSISPEKKNGIIDNMKKIVNLDHRHFLFEHKKTVKDIEESQLYFDLLTNLLKKSKSYKPIDNLKINILDVFSDPDIEDYQVCREILRGSLANLLFDLFNVLSKIKNVKQIFEQRIRPINKFIDESKYEELFRYINEDQLRQFCYMKFV